MTNCTSHYRASNRVLRLNDANGKVVQRQTGRGGEWIEMSLGAIANGVYFLIAEQDGKYTQTKVLKHQ